ncbi:MAG TPA: tetratricopeptide repeat protein, partial [Bacteroidales bacterium]|nr:tetratricopeptide repeat protein [Bacteroidales bacterium]
AFYLAGLLMYLRYLRSGKRSFLAYTMLLFIFSLLSKPAAVTFPVMIFMMDLYYRRKLKPRVLLEKIPFLVLAIAIGLLIIAAREQAGHIIDISARFSGGERMLMVVYALAFYIARLFVPTGLSAFHPYPSDGLTLVYYIAPLVPMMILFLLWRLRGEARRQTMAGLAFFVVAIAIVMEIIPVGAQVVKERYVYLPSVGIYYAFAGLLIFFTFGRKAARWLPQAITLIILIVFGLVTFSRAQVWRDSISLWDDVLSKYPEASAAYINRGNEWLAKEDFNRAIGDYKLALEYEPMAADAYLNRGLAYFRMQEPLKALSDFNQAISLGIQDAETYNNRGLLKASLMDTRGAIADFDKALELDPKNTEAWINKGLVLANDKNYRQAFNAFSQAVNTDPSSARAYFWRGMVQYRMGLRDDACRDFSAAVKRGWPSAQVPPGVCE